MYVVTTMLINDVLSFVCMYYYLDHINLQNVLTNIHLAEFYVCTFILCKIIATILLLLL